MWAVPAQGVRVMGGSRSSRSHDTRHGYAATEEILIAIQTFHVKRENRVQQTTPVPTTKPDSSDFHRIPITRGRALGTL